MDIGVSCVMTGSYTWQTHAGCAGGIGQALERAKGIEPSYAAWEAAVLPLNYARALLLRTCFKCPRSGHITTAANPGSFSQYRPRLQSLPA